MTFDDPEWYEKLSLDWHGGYESAFGDGARVSLDPCQHCVRDAMGAWLCITRGDGDAVSIEAMNASIVGAATGRFAGPDGSQPEGAGALRRQGLVRALCGVLKGDASEEIHDATAEAGSQPDVDRQGQPPDSHQDYRVMEFHEGEETWHEFR